MCVSTTFGHKCPGIFPVVEFICRPRIVRLPNISLLWEKYGRMASKMPEKKHDIYI